MTQANPEPSDKVPETVATVLEESSDNQLREIIHYAQALLREQSPLTDEIKSRKGEELVRIEDHGAYTIVVVRRPDATGEARGPFAYRVKWEDRPGNEDGKYRWHYLGRVHGESGGD